MKIRVEERERYLSHYNKLTELSNKTDSHLIKSRLDEIFYAVKLLDENITGIRGVLTFFPNE